MTKGIIVLACSCALFACGGGSNDTPDAGVQPDAAAADADTTSPTLTGVTPPDGSVDNPSDAAITATLDEAAGAGAITLADVSGAPIAGASAVAGDTYTFTPDTALADGIYTATLAGAADQAGNPIAGGNVSWTFALGVPASVAGAQGTFVFGQNGTTTDTDGSFFAGQANAFDIFPDYSLDDGGDDQCDNCNMLVLDPGGAPASFPSDETAAEASFSTPAIPVVAAIAGDGSWIQGTIRPAAPPVTGAYSGYLAPIDDARLQQTIDLTAATGNVTMTWNDNARICAGDASPTIPAYYRIRVLDAAGNQLELLYDSSVGGNDPLTADLSAYVGQSIVVSFEQYGQGQRGDWVTACSLIVDDVSVTDGAATQLASNGDFETGDLTGWTTNAATNLQNVTSGPRTVAGLTVTRSFFTRPELAWGRWLDELTNPTAADITVDVQEQSNFGSDGCGVIYSNGGNLGEWDLGADDADIGFAYGNGVTFTFTTATTIAASGCDGNEIITADYGSVTVPAGATKALLSYVVLVPGSTGVTTQDPTAHATSVDTALDAITAGYATDPRYREGLTAAQLAEVVNF